MNPSSLSAAEDASAEKRPLVTVVCLCYRQARYVRAALDSVQQQTYPHLELLVVDDGSDDGSADVIRAWQARTGAARAVLLLPRNEGNCRAFNRALALARGTFVVDLAADDALHPDRIARQVAGFAARDASYAVAFSDAWLLDAHGRVTGRHLARRDAQGRPVPPVPEGDVYAALLGRFFLLSPTVMFRTAALRALGGYDPTLAYEDFDILLRLARAHRFFFQDECLTFRRQVPGSLSGQFYRRRRNALLASTLRICRRAQQLNRTPAEDAALAFAVRYHARQALFTENFALARAFWVLLDQLPGTHPTDAPLAWLSARRVPLGKYYAAYQRLRARRN